MIRSGERSSGCFFFVGLEDGWTFGLFGSWPDCYDASQCDDDVTSPEASLHVDEPVLNSLSVVRVIDPQILRVDDSRRHIIEDECAQSIAANHKSRHQPRLIWVPKPSVVDGNEVRHALQDGKAQRVDPEEECVVMCACCDELHGKTDRTSNSKRHFRVHAVLDEVAADRADQRLEDDRGQQQIRRLLLGDAEVDGYVRRDVAVDVEGAWVEHEDDAADQRAHLLELVERGLLRVICWLVLLFLFVQH